MGSGRALKELPLPKRLIRVVSFEPLALFLASRDLKEVPWNEDMMVDGTCFPNGLIFGTRFLNHVLFLCNQYY